MFSYDTIEEFIESLYREKKIINFLFEKRKRTVLYENLLSFVELKKEKIDYLINEKFLIKTGNTIELNEELIDFFEKFSNATEEINNEYTHGLIANLKSNIDIYSEEKNLEKKNEYLIKIKQSLRRIGRNIIGNINRIRKNIEDVYITEKNYKIKKIKLDEYSHKANQIKELIENITKLLKSNDWESFYKFADDNGLIQVTYNLQKEIKTAWINFADISQKIIDFHNQMRKQSDFFKKVQNIKKLKDSNILTVDSNIKNVLENENGLFFSKQRKFKTQVSIPFLQTDQALPLIIRVAKKNKYIKELSTNDLAEDISEKHIKSKEKVLSTRSLLLIKQHFADFDGDLIDFITSSNLFEQLSLEQKSTLFCRIASRYSNELTHQGGYKNYNGIEYAIIRMKK